MKKFTFILTVFFAITITANAQIPNNGFEDWNVYGNGMIPVDWWSTNDSVSSSGTYFPITRSTDHYPANVGSYSIRIANDTLLLPDWAGLGITWTGDWDGNNNPSFPVNGHPNSLCGYYKFQPQNNDSMRIFIALYHEGIEVAQASLTDPAAAPDWTAFNIAFGTYTTADSARIMLSAFDADSFQIHGNSVLYVDNLSFNTPVTSVPDNISSTIDFALYPNPASDIITLSMDTKYNAPLTLDIYDVTGALVKSASLKTNQPQIDISEIKNGVYIVSVISNDLTSKQRLIIQK